MEDEDDNEDGADAFNDDDSFNVDHLMGSSTSSNAMGQHGGHSQSFHSTADHVYHRRDLEEHQRIIKQHENQVTGT